MTCNDPFVYAVRPGDTLYTIARRYNTTPEHIESLNPHIHPHNLRIGSTLIVCAGAAAEHPASPPANGVSPQLLELSNAMRGAWEQHVSWTRNLILSIAHSLPDEDAVTARLLRNPGDIAALFAPYYGEDAAKKIAELIKQHLVIGKELILAAKNNDPKAQELDAQWHSNADDLAAYLSGLNPHYDYDALKEMLYAHLALTNTEVAERLAGHYPADIAAYDQIEREALRMADAFVSGIAAQFPEKFVD